jgi:YVTN family beta-propeller protein
VNLYLISEEQRAYYEVEVLNKKGIFSSVYLVLIIVVLSSVPSFLDDRFFNTAQAHSATIPVGNLPHDIKYDPTNKNIYVVNTASSTVSVISGSTNSVIATTLVGWVPVWLVYVPSNNKIYVTNEGSNDTYVINAATDVVVSTTPLRTSYSSTSPILLTYVSDNDALYVSRHPQEVSVINAVTNADVHHMKVDGNPAGSAYNPTNHNIYVTKFSSNQVSVINTITNSVVANIPVGDFPTDIVYNPVNHNMYVTNQGSNTVSVIDSTTNSVIGTIPVGTKPIGITYDTSNNHIYVANAGSNTVTIIHP